MKRLIIYIIVSILCIPQTEAGGRNIELLPNDTVKSDTIITILPLSFEKKPDTLKNSDPILNYINQRRSKNRFNEWVGGLLIRNEQDSSSNDNTINYIKEYKRLSQKTIANIHITRLDPFGTSINDTTKQAQQWIEQTGNNLRFATSKRIIRKNLTMKPGTPFDPRDVFESERVLRQINFIADSRIVVLLNKDDTTKVDLQVITRDRYPHAFSTGGNLSSPQITLYSRNLTGNGVGFSHTSAYDFGQRVGNKEQLSINNFNRSRIDLEANYSNMIEDHSLSFRADRNFYISDIKYAGGILYNRSFRNNRHPAYSQAEWENELNYQFSDFWLGRSFEINTDNYFDRSHLYLIGQYSHSEFYDIPDSLSNNVQLASNYYFYGSVTFSKRNYYQNNKIYNFDRTEDVPHGFMTTLTYGINKMPTKNRPYLRGEFSFGKAIIPNKGYFYGSIEAGSFFDAGKSEQGEVSIRGKYISRLFDMGVNQFRNFFEVKYIKGFNRYQNEYLLLTEKAGGINSFRDKEIKGVERLIIKTENVLFTQHRFMGFNIMFLNFADLGIIGDGRNLFKQNYQASLGGAIRFINNKLVFNSIEIRLAWLPLLPEGEFPLDLRISGESIPRFDDFIPKAPKQDTFK